MLDWDIVHHRLYRYSTSHRMEFCDLESSLRYSFSCFIFLFMLAFNRIWLLSFHFFLAVAFIQCIRSSFLSSSVFFVVIWVLTSFLFYYIFCLLLIFSLSFYIYMYFCGLFYYINTVFWSSLEFKWRHYSLLRIHIQLLFKFDNSLYNLLGYFFCLNFSIHRSFIVRLYFPLIINGWRSVIPRFCVFSYFSAFLYWLNLFNLTNLNVFSRSLSLSWAWLFL